MKGLILAMTAAVYFIISEPGILVRGKPHKLSGPALIQDLSTLTISNLDGYDSVDVVAARGMKPLGEFGMTSTQDLSMERHATG